MIFHSPSLPCLPDDLFFYDYDLGSVFNVTDPLGIPWHPISKKGQDFGMTFNHLGFIWDLTAWTVSLPDDKGNQSLLKLITFTSKQHVSWNNCTSLLGTLQHVCFVYQDTHSSLPALSSFLEKFPNNFFLQHTPCTVLSDLEIWQNCLFCQTVTCSLIPQTHFDPNLHIDVSSLYGVGFAIENRYVGWQLIDGWAYNGQDIGWAESVALELSIYWLIQEGYQDMHITIHSDNTGVIGAFSSSCSHNPAHNNSICHIMASLILTNVTISPKYITSGKNLNDPVSHGIISGYGSWINCTFPLPADLVPWLTPI